jgi:hypothetical protein
MSFERVMFLLLSGLMLGSIFGICLLLWEFLVK